MTSKSKLSALNKGLNVERDLDFSDSSSYQTSDTALRLIGFCLVHLGGRPFNLQSLPNESIDNVLNHNDIHHRRVDISTFHICKEYPLLIVSEIDTNKYFAFYYKSGKNWIYDPYIEKHYLYTSQIKLNLDSTAFEIYLSLPPVIKGPIDILKFAFSTELRPIISLVIASVVVMLFNLCIPIFTNILISKVLPQSDLTLLFESFYSVLLITAGLMITQYLQNLMMLRIESVADLKLQSAVWDRVMKLPMNFISKYNTGDLTSRVNSISQLRDLLGNGLLSSLLSSLFAISYFGLMYYYDVRLSIWASVFTVFSAICVVFIIWRSIRLQLPLIESGAEITNFSLQSVMGMPQVRSAGAEPFLFLRWISEIRRFSLLQLRSGIYSDALEQYATLISPISSLYIFAVLAFQILSKNAPVNTFDILVTFISFNAAFLAFNSAMTSAVNIISNVVGKAVVLWIRAKPVIYQSVEPGYLPSAIYHDLRGEFNFNEVSYSFPGRQELLFSNISFEIRPGEHTAITGPSGCGKTTIVRMLLGFTQPSEGHISVDGIPINQLSIRSYRRQLGVVMQNARVNAGSIYNIVCGGIQRQESDVWRALELAAIADEVRNMPMQLETILNDSGTNVSGGQVQRIAIARALITNPKVLIMDEATSALDNESQNLITKSITEMGITRITIAHRLSTIKYSDQIIVIEKGKPVASGDWLNLSSHGYIKHMISSA